MGRVKKIIALWMGMLCFILAGCSGAQEHRPIEDVNNLDGRRIGVGMGYATDYLLTGREDIELLRYYAYADLIMALRYHRLDAVAVERPTAYQFLNSVAGLRIVEPAFSQVGLAAYMANSREDIFQAFNEFAAEFKSTEEYADIVERVNAPGTFQEKEVVPTGKGEVISVAVVMDNYPYCYVDFETGELKGSDMEYLIHFANACDYQLDLQRVDYTTMELGLVYERYDMGFSGISDVWKEDLLLVGSVLVSDVYMHADVVLVEVEDFDKLEIIQVIEE